MIRCPVLIRLFIGLYICFSYEKSSANSNLSDLESKAKLILDKNEPTLINTVSGVFGSFDPLDADYTKNIRVMRLLYSTPVEKDENGKLSSSILDRFEYNEVLKTLTFQLKSGLNFSDGSSITLDDLKLSILRMLHERPTFDPLKYIEGIDKWQAHGKKLDTLPSGLSLNEKTRTLTIKLSQHVNHPFERFTMEIFSVIPKKCIDTKSAKMICATPPFSGDYTLEENDSPFLKFRKRSSNKNIPDRLNIVFMSPVRVIKYLENFRSNHVILSNEIDIPPEHRFFIKSKFRDNSIPEVRFFALVLNKRTKTFENKRVRQYFAKEYRSTLNKLFGREDGSIFTQISPGYISLGDLYDKAGNFSKKEEQEIRNHLKTHPPKWMKNSFANHDPFQIYLKETLKRLGISESPILPEKDRKKEMELWKKGEFDIRPTHSGLDTNDPTLDLKMLFTKNMHYFLIDLQDDIHLQQMLGSINHTQVKKMDINLLKKINQYLFEESVFSIVANYSIGQYTLKDSKLKFTNVYKTNSAHYFINTP
ncbi:MAG: ABC transporter substrate-binding protein [Oligoflexales bacterium]